MSEARRIAHADLVQFFRDALAAVEVPDHVAEIEAEIGAEVDLCGVHTHGARLLPTMIEQGRGSILNVSSGAAQRAIKGRVGYSTSKAALERFSIGLAEEVREHGIAVNAWTPGLVATDMNNQHERGAPPEAVAESAVWLAAQDASFTGNVVAREEFGVAWGER